MKFVGIESLTKRCLFAENLSFFFFFCTEEKNSLAENSLRCIPLMVYNKTSDFLLIHNSALRAIKEVFIKFDIYGTVFDKNICNILVMFCTVKRLRAMIYKFIKNLATEVLYVIYFISHFVNMVYYGVDRAC